MRELHRITLLVCAPTSAQRGLRFPDDLDAVEPVEPAIARAINDALRRWDVCWRGPEARAAETAAALGVDAVPDDALRGWRMGKWAGTRVEEVAERDPDALAAWRQDPGAAPPGGESLLELVDRAAVWLIEHTHAGGEAPSEHALVIADPAVVRALVVAALGLPPDAVWRFDVRPWSMTILGHRGEAWRAEVIGADARR